MRDREVRVRMGLVVFTTEHAGLTATFPAERKGDAGYHSHCEKLFEPRYHNAECERLSVSLEQGRALTGL